MLTVNVQPPIGASHRVPPASTSRFKRGRKLAPSGSREGDGVLAASKGERDADADADCERDAEKVGETAIGLERRKLAATEMRAYQERTEGQLRDLARTWDEAFAVVGS